jgi:hypothetical protein
MTQNIITPGGASDPLAFTGGNDGTLVLQTGPSGAKVNALAFASDGTPTFLKGRLLAQVQTSAVSAVATGTTVIPVDDTIPQITEGDQYMTLAITPVNVNSTLEIDILFNASTSGGGPILAALFQDATANALAAFIIQQATGTGGVTHVLKHVMTAGTTSATTFRIRAGGTAGTLTFNGASGVRQFGGVMASRITIKEYLP